MIISRSTYNKNAQKNKMEIIGVVSMNNLKYAVVNNYDKQRTDHFEISDNEAIRIMKAL